jgi:inorganic pyrophosphatase
VISERAIDRADITMTATVVGGLQMLDGDEADDKIIAVLARDPFWGNVTDVEQLPPALIDRLAHYFETYKLRANEPAETRITQRYGATQARVVVNAALDDYQAHFGSQTNPAGAGDS